MTTMNDDPARIMPLMRKHEIAIMKIAATFYRPGTYCFNAMVCDLFTYLWQVFASLPSDVGLRNEQAWVYVILSRKAHKLSCDELRYQSHLEYDADLSNVSYGDDSDRIVDKLYYLVDQLDEEEQTIITQYLEQGNMVKTAKAMRVSYLKLARRMSHILDKLVQLNKALGDDFDVDAANAGGAITEKNKS